MENGKWKMENARGDPCYRSRLFLPGGGVVAAEGVQFAVGADDVGAAAVDAVFVPRPGVHEGFDEQAEGVGFVEFEFMKETSERFTLATALREVFEGVAHFVAEESLHGGEVDEL